MMDDFLSQIFARFATNHYAPNYLNPLPPKELIAAWEKDSKTMQEQMIYGVTLPFLPSSKESKNYK
jgi:hypothetical protein